MEANLTTHVVWEEIMYGIKSLYGHCAGPRQYKSLIHINLMI